MKYNLHKTFTNILFTKTTKIDILPTRIKISLHHYLPLIMGLITINLKSKFLFTMKIFYEINFQMTILILFLSYMKELNKLFT